MKQAYFEFQTPPRLLAGALALEHIPHELRLLGAHRPLLISDAGLVRTGLLALCERALREGETPAQAARFVHLADQPDRRDIPRKRM